MDASNLDMGGFALFSVMGICVVFVALILIMAMIKILVAVTSKKSAPKASAADSAPAAAAPKAEPVLAPGTAGELNLYDTDPRDAAMVMAIVADELKKPLNELRFISIKEVK